MRRFSSRPLGLLAGTPMAIQFDGGSAAMTPVGSTSEMHGAAIPSEAVTGRKRQQ